MKERYYLMDASEVIKSFESDYNGLSSEEARARLLKYGTNELPKQKRNSVFKIFLNEFKDYMKIILIITVILSFLIGEIFDAITLIVIIMVDVIIGTVEEWRALKATESLIDMIKVKTHVIRDGDELETYSENIVIGDIIELESGSKVSADARIIECHNFQVNESALTGESNSAGKNSEVIDEDVMLAERKNMVYAGSSVVTGRARCIVTATGVDTEIGKISEKVTNALEEKSPLTIRMEKFSKQISGFIIFVAIFIGIILFFKHNSLSDIFLGVIALSVSAMPEGLSLALTMALTIASKRMARKNVIVKKLKYASALGNCGVIASDKTGTLTVNEQTAREIVLSDGSRYEITGTGYNDDGQVNCVDNSDIEKALEIAFLGYINNEAHLEKKNDKWEYFGDSIDIAFLSLAKKMHIDENVHIIDYVPYESDNQYSAVFYEMDGKKYCTVKGSLEKVMMFSEEKDLYKKQNLELTNKGYRVIALANGEVSGTTDSIHNLKFIGMVAFIDPIRVEVKESIDECLSAGIKVIMITGDHPLTAGSIAKELGLIRDNSEVATGADVEEYRKLGEREFDKFVSRVKVFSRVTPIDKLDIVNSLKRQGEFVAVTGDGVNDAPAIKSANIGIAMGSGTDVAKETASMIISDDNFTTIANGIKEGRVAYSNIRKITLFLISCGLSEVLIFIMSVLSGYNIPLVAIQLLWINIVTDGLQDIALSFEKGDDDIMKERPRDIKEPLFTKDLIIEILILGIGITMLVFGLWKYLMDRNTNILVARSIILMLMVFIQNINVLNCRNEKESLFNKSLFSNPVAMMTIFGSIFFHILISQNPITAAFLKVTPLPFITIVKIFILSLFIIVIFEIYKLIFKRINNLSGKKNVL